MVAALSAIARNRRPAKRGSGGAAQMPLEDVADGKGHVAAVVAIAGDEAGPHRGDQNERQQRHQRSDQECDAHQQALIDGVAKGGTGHAVNFFLGGGVERIGRGAQQFDDAVADLAAEALAGERVEQALLDDIGLALGFAADAIEFAAQDGGFRRGCRDRRRRPSRGAPASGRGEGGEDDLGAHGDRAAQAGEYSGGRQHAVLDAEDDLADVGEPLEGAAVFFGFGRMGGFNTQLQYSVQYSVSVFGIGGAEIGAGLPIGGAELA